MVEEVLKYRLKELRKSHNITQAALASDIGVSESTISKWESGNAIPDIEMLCTLSEYFDVSIDELLDRNALLKRKISDWHLQNKEKQPYTSNTELLGSLINADDLLIQLVLKKLELADVISIIAFALKRCDFDVSRLKDELYQIKGFPGLTGNTSFDNKGDVIKDVMIKRVDGSGRQEVIDVFQMDE